MEVFLPKQTTVSIIGKQCEDADIAMHVYNFCCSQRSCRLFKNNLCTDCYPFYIVKWQCNSNFEKETAKTSFASPQEIYKFLFLFVDVRKKVQFHTFTRAYTLFSNEAFCFVLLHCSL